jgi:nucleoside-diphosphate-sugar epimerase
MRVLITGGAGFIGCNTADYLLRQGHEAIMVPSPLRRSIFDMPTNCRRCLLVTIRLMPFFILRRKLQ